MNENDRTQTDRSREPDGSDHGFTESDWEILLDRIESGKCTPFLGAGACHPTLPLGSDIAREWSKEYNYPLCDCGDLARVAQFLAVTRDAMFPKGKILKHLGLRTTRNEQDGVKLDTERDYEPHRVLARLPLPVFMTTNYDDLLIQALKDEGKDPEREFCQWNEMVRNRKTIFACDSDFMPDKDHPVVYHLHGHSDVEESLVLTEDDYLDFLVRISNDPNLLPLRIKGALTNSLLFVGYGLTDWSFRVLYRGLVSATERCTRKTSATVQLPPWPSDDKSPEQLVEVFLKSGDRISGRKLVSKDKDQADNSKIELDTIAMGIVSIDRNEIERERWIGPPDKSRQASAKTYLTRYFDDMDIRVFWGEADDFMKELSNRWEAFSK